MKKLIILIFSCLFLLTSCLEFKDSVFDTKTSIKSQWNTKFTVPSYNLAGGDTVTFGVFSDSHQNYSDLDKTIFDMGKQNLDFAVFTGDFTDFGSRDEYEVFYSFLNDATYPIYVVPGNHDLTTTGRAMFRKIFGPENFLIDTDFGRMIFFNNNALELAEGVNYDFLNQAVSTANATQPLFVFQHQDPQNSLSFSNANQALYQGYLNAFANDVYLFHGHLHNFNRTQLGANTEVFQVSRIEEGRWMKVEIDSTQVRTYQCVRRKCNQVFP